MSEKANLIICLDNGCECDISFHFKGKRPVCKFKKQEKALEQGGGYMLQSFRNLGNNRNCPHLSQY